MIYYIPIHTDNIDNVLSAEGISPADDYVSHGYGYSRFTPLKDMPTSNEIYLFYHIPNIDDDSVRRDQICYIEFDDKYNDSRNGYTPFAEGVVVSETVELFPWNCKILFTTNEALYQAVMFCRSSLCNKMWGYYQFSLIEPHSYSCVKSVFPESISSIKSQNADAQRNRLKGFLFSFTLGRYISIPQSLANLLQTEKRLYDVATTIAGLQSYEKESFLRQLNELEEQFEQYDPIRLDIQKQWQAMIENSFSDKSNQMAFESIVKELGAEDLLKSFFAQKKGYTVRQRPQMALARPSDWADYKKSIEDYTLSIIQSYRSRHNNTNTNEDFQLEDMRIHFNPKYDSYYSLLVSKAIEGLDWFNIEHLRLNRLEFASDLTRLLRDMLIESGQLWEGSPIRQFMNDLRQHIATGAPFDISKAPDITLESLAIFVLKGDDYEEMLRFMENNAQVDYRFVLGLMGACVGYVDIPKTLIQRMRIDNDGLSSIYMSALSYMTKLPDAPSMELHTYDLKNKPRSYEASDCFNKVINDKSLGLTKAQKDALRDLWEESDEKASDLLFERIAHVKGIGKVKLGIIKRELSQKILPPVKEQLELFENHQVETKKRIDLTAWQYIESMLPDDTAIKEKVKEDFDWFITRRRRTESNRSIISNYKEHLREKAFSKTPRYFGTSKYFSALNIDDIIEQLSKFYL